MVSVRSYNSANTFSPVFDALTLYIDVLTQYIDALTLYIDILTQYIDALLQYIGTLTLYIEALTLYIDALTQYIDALMQYIGAPTLLNAIQMSLFDAPMLLNVNQMLLKEFMQSLIPTKNALRFGRAFFSNKIYFLIAGTKSIHRLQQPTQLLPKYYPKYNIAECGLKIPRIINGLCSLAHRHLFLSQKKVPFRHPEQLTG